MSLPLAVVDFETAAIEPRPASAPKPVGVAVRVEGRPGGSRYYAWGHPAGNNCTQEAARAVLQDLWRTHELLFHNASFDLEVAYTHLGLKIPPWEQLHDTLFLAFLHDPYARDLGLKGLAGKHLATPPEEQRALWDWLLKHDPEAKAAWNRARKSKEPERVLGAFIANAPGNVVGRYAKGDVDRTYALFQHWQGLRGEAYDRERRLLPHLLKMTFQGVPLDQKRLAAELAQGEESLREIEHWIHERLGDFDVDLGSSKQLANALEDAGVIEGDHETGFVWIMTPPSKTHPEGQRSTSIESLALVVTDPELMDALRYRSALGKQITTYARPWQKFGKWLSCTWNQVRQASQKGAGLVGARTGRLSSSPNLQNIPMRVPELPAPIPRAKLIDFRQIVRAPEGHLLYDCDYSQQELRILAHFAGGSLAQVYNDDPNADLHTVATQRLGLPPEDRPRIKALGFGIIYGMGLRLLSETMDCDEDRAREIRLQYKAKFSGVANLEWELRQNGYCTTFGGRVIRVEEPRLVNGEWRTYEFKQLNHLIQGSAADQSKEAMIRYAEATQHGQLVCSVHDQLCGMAAREHAEKEFKLLKEAMESVELNVPVRAEGAIGATWRECHA